MRQQEAVGAGRVVCSPPRSYLSGLVERHGVDPGVFDFGADS